MTVFSVSRNNNANAPQTDTSTHTKCNKEMCLCLLIVFFFWLRIVHDSHNRAVVFMHHWPRPLFCSPFLLSLVPYSHVQPVMHCKILPLKISALTNGPFSFWKYESFTGAATAQTCHFFHSFARTNWQLLFVIGVKSTELGCCKL